MKKVLLATSALVAFAGAAHADLTMSGYGRMGIVSTDGVTSQYSRMQVQFNGSTQADNGMTVGASMRLRPTGATASVNAPRVYASVNGMTIEAGNVFGAMDGLPNVYGSTVGFSGGSFQGLVNQADAMGYSSTGAGAQGLGVSYNAGAFNVALTHQFATDDNQLAVSYSANGLTVGLSAQMSDVDARDETVVSLGYTMGDFSISVASSDNNGNRKSNVSVSAKAGAATTIAAYVVQDDSEADNGFGIGVSHGLGGGVTFGAGAERLFDGTDRLEAGLNFAF
jgi:outer membrane protein OmpU